MPPTAPLELEELAERARAGEPSAFAEIVRRSNARLYRVARGILGDDGEAEDALQDAYVIAFRKLDRFEGRGAFAGWLRRITVREALARLERRRRPLPEEDPVRPTPPRDPDRQTSDRELRAWLEEAIDLLPDAYRATFVLRVVDERSGAEAAELLGVPEETVKTRLHRARALLREALLARAEGQATTVFELHAARCERIAAAVLAQLGDAP